VEDQLRAAIRSGRLVAEARLPSSRVLAADLGVSRGVVSDAYMQLAAEGWLVVAPRSVPRVASLPPVAAVGEEDVAPAAAPRYDLRPGRPDLARFPRADWVRSLAGAVRSAGDVELDYGPVAGSPRLRSVLAAYRGRVRGTVSGPDAVLVCAGAAQAFTTIADALVAAAGGPGAPAPRIAVEDPGHDEIRRGFARRGLAPVAVPVDGEGLVVDALPPDAAAVLVTPAHQFPTGVVMSPARRAALLGWAQARGAVVVEDDYDAEYRYDRAPVGALQGLRPDLVLHIGSVSKTLAPALRLGWLVAPPAWRARLLAARQGLDHGQPALEQLALADFVERGAYDRHVRRSGRAYRRRRDALVAALEAELPSAVVSGAAAGLHMAVTVPPVADEGALVAACRDAGVALDGLGRHRVAPAPDGAGATLLLSFAAVPEAAAGHVARLIAGAVGSTTLGGA
jgi:GntR family transcriptional regulator/MocR family aminotransferase